MFNPINASKHIQEDFKGYIRTTYQFDDPEYAQLFSEALDEDGRIAKGPYIELESAFETGASLEQLMDEQVASPLFQDLEGNVAEADKEIKLQRPLYRHQEMAMRKAAANRNMVVTTGTGSGKTECFILPIINELLKQKKQGKLDAGVRAVIIYPMNALANDQMKRFRAILKDYPAITFGVYNGNTQKDDEKAIRSYKELNEQQEPIPNEMLSRERMQKTPPHILITNYSMLEYMLLRPGDTPVFDGAKLKFLVLDEAHIYRGGTGMETALLLRRTKARIGQDKPLVHILTSATLGEKRADRDIIQFAGNLCDAKFSTEDIIRSTMVPCTFSGDAADYPLALFTKLAQADEGVNQVFAQYEIPYDKALPVAENLYQFLEGTRFYRLLRDIAKPGNPGTAAEYAAAMQAELPEVTEDDVQNLLQIAAQASWHKTALVKIRYHMFVRALEGAFLTIVPNQEKHVFIKRREYLDEGTPQQQCVFECAVCKDCGQIAILGKVDEKQHKLCQVSNVYQLQGKQKMDVAVYLLNPDRGMELDRDDEDEIAPNNEADYLLCSRCGEIHHVSQAGAFACGHGTDSLVQVRKEGFRNEDSPAINCPSCQNGQFRFFYLGYDAATAVLGTSLFEELPEKKLLPQAAEVDQTPAFLGGGKVKKVKATPVRRQFLTFSDSRSEAAYFASYMSESYQDYLRRRGLYHILAENPGKTFEFADLVNSLKSYFYENKTFEQLVVNNEQKRTLDAESLLQARIAVVNELVNYRRANSLVGFGQMRFVYKGMEIAGTDGIDYASILEGLATNEESPLAKYNLSPAEIRQILDALILEFAKVGAVDCKDFGVGEDTRKYLFFSEGQKYFVKSGTAEDRKNPCCYSWSPAKVESKAGESYYRRSYRLMNMLNYVGKKLPKRGEPEYSELAAEGVKLLDWLWDNILCNTANGYRLHTVNNKTERERILSLDSLCIQSLVDEDTLYQCDTCRHTTVENYRNQCPKTKCQGHLHKIRKAEYLRGNHYLRLYSSPKMQPLLIKEHTAQLSKKEGEKYQKLFVEGTLNALSCSTTFEMGVDVGSLETVYLRDMPPTPANYVQRAGRAGRALGSAAFVLTYAKLGSHDLTYYDSPQDMIMGRIKAPQFSLTNVKVTRRHIYAVALSMFFALNPDVYDDNNAYEMLNGNGFARLVEWLESKPLELKQMLQQVIPNEDGFQEELGIADFKWTDDLISKEGVLRVAIDAYRNTLEEFEKLRDEARNQKQDRMAAYYDDRLREMKAGKDDSSPKKTTNKLIEFLSKNNILPKYGFPVDTVGLYTSPGSAYGNDDKSVQLQRDLQMAVSEYAPGAQVVADGKVYTSRYIRNERRIEGQSWETGFIAKCRDKDCESWNWAKINADKPCKACGKTIYSRDWMPAIIPRNGFIAELNPPQVSMSHKPKKIYHSDAFYVGNTAEKQKINRTSLPKEDSWIVRMDSSRNDEMMVVSNNKFYVCHQCGYTVNENELKAGKEKVVKNCVERQHIKPYMDKEKCSNKSLREYRLFHKFKTDVVLLKFNMAQARDKQTMMSVMYALLEGAAKELNIERSDIQGCLNFNAPQWDIILYDSTAGGAGQIRRLAQEDGIKLHSVIRTALEIIDGCDCSPSCYSCLRNYYNQKVHDQLNRHKASAFLHELEKAAFIKNQEEEDHVNWTVVDEGYDYTVNVAEAEEIFSSYLIKENRTEKDRKYYQDKLAAQAANIRKPDYEGTTFSTEGDGNEQDAYADFYWHSEGVILFFDSGKEDYARMRNSPYHCYLLDENFPVDEFVERVKK